MFNSHIEEQQVIMKGGKKENYFLSQINWANVDEGTSSHPPFNHKGHSR